MSDTPDAVVVGTYTVTDTAGPCGAPGGVAEFYVQSAEANGGNVNWGDADSQPFVLKPGESISLDIDSPSAIYWYDSGANGYVIQWFIRKA